MRGEDRIRLAEAMGWGMTIDTHPDQPLMTEPGKPNAGMLECPNPFTDANDDYAVLEWMHHKDDSKAWKRFVEQLEAYPEIGHKCAYRIGDYARAALKVLEATDG